MITPGEGTCGEGAPKNSRAENIRADFYGDGTEPRGPEDAGRETLDGHDQDQERTLFRQIAMNGVGDAYTWEKQTWMIGDRHGKGTRSVTARTLAISKPDGVRRCPPVLPLQ